MMVLTVYVLAHEWILHTRPRDWPVPASGLMMPPEAPVKPSGLTHGAGAPVKSRVSKKIRKKIDTLEYKAIRGFSDSLAHN